MKRAKADAPKLKLKIKKMEKKEEAKKTQVLEPIPRAETEKNTVPSQPLAQEPEKNNQVSNTIPHVMICVHTCTCHTPCIAEWTSRRGRVHYSIIQTPSNYNVSLLVIVICLLHIELIVHIFSNYSTIILHNIISNEVVEMAKPHFYQLQFCTNDETQSRWWAEKGLSLFVF